MFKTKSYAMKVADKTRKKYYLTKTRRLRILKAKWFTLLVVSLIAGIVLWNYPEFIFEGIYDDLRDTHIIYQKIDSNTPQVANFDKKEALASDVPSQIRQIATKECNERNLEDYCVKDMLSIAYTESRFNCNTNGDSGKSKGCYQIHLGYHPDITECQAEDLNFAIHWTLDRMQHYGYPKFRSYAIMKHNGTPFTAKTLAYLESVNNYFKSL